MHHVLLPEPDGAVFFDFWVLVRGFGVEIVNLPISVPAHFHPVRHQGIQGYHLAPSVPDDLGESIPPQQKVGHESLPKDEAGHLRVRGIMEKPGQRMVEIPHLPISLPVVPKEMKGKSCNGFRKDPDAGVNCCHLHGGPLVHRLPGRRTSEKEPVSASQKAVLGLVSGPKPGKWIEHNSLLLYNLLKH